MFLHSKPRRSHYTRYNFLSGGGRTLDQFLEYFLTPRPTNPIVSTTTFYFILLLFTGGHFCYSHILL